MQVHLHTSVITLGLLSASALVVVNLCRPSQCRINRDAKCESALGSQILKVALKPELSKAMYIISS